MAATSSAVGLWTREVVKGRIWLILSQSPPALNRYSDQRSTCTPTPGAPRRVATPLIVSWPALPGPGSTLPTMRQRPGHRHQPPCSAAKKPYGSTRHIDPMMERAPSAPATRSAIGDAHPRTDAAALISPLPQLRIRSAGNRRNRCVSVTPDPGGDPMEVA